MKTLKDIITVLVMVICLVMFLSIPVEAKDCQRFGSNLVHTGDYAFIVEKVAGQPMYKDLVLDGKGRGPKLEHWVYEQHNTYIYLTFRNNKLVKIETLYNR